MDNDELRKLLQQLHDEITKVEAVDEKGNRLLRHLDRDICIYLERADENPVQLHPPFIRRLENTLLHFEVTHPGLTAVISRLLTYLSNAGI